MHVLIPGRHHLLTNFQFHYLNDLIRSGLSSVSDVSGNAVEENTPIDSFIFAVTSANHSGTKRNPIPFYLRSMMLQSFSQTFEVPSYIYGIDDIGVIDDFAGHVVKQIRHQSDYKLDLNPDNTLVICSTPLLSMYKSLGYTVLPCELKDLDSQTYHHDLPWKFVEQIAFATDWQSDPTLMQAVHSSSLNIWKNYNLDTRVAKIMGDPILGEDGDITESRDYNSYVRQMDEIAELKYAETAPFIQSGNIGDIGCAVGSWIKLACNDPKLTESDFYGIEVARQLFEICSQRKVNREFDNPNVFFAQKNAVTGLVFQQNTMHTIHTSSLTHEIASYGSMDDLQSFIHNRHDELVNGGVWINRDVIGPENGNQEVLMLLNERDGSNGNFDQRFSERKTLADYLQSLSTYTRFKRFALDFRLHENDQIQYSEVVIQDKKFIKLKLTDACEYMLTKDYTDNWESEMHERFCFWSFEDWKTQMVKAGFDVLPGSRPYTNPWIQKNRFSKKVKLYTLHKGELTRLPEPPTNAIIIGKRLVES